MNNYIGLDIGTSSTKSVLFDSLGNKIKSFEVEYQISNPKVGFAEENPDDWVNATLKTLDLIGKSYSNVKAISFSGQMHGLVLLDKEDKVLRPAIIWCDSRTSKEVREIEEIIGNKKIKEITGSYITLSFTLAKLLWVKNNEPEIFNKIDKVMLPKDYVRYKLTGVWSTDISDASGMQMLDIKKKEYSDYILNKLQIPKEILPPIKKSYDVVSQLKLEYEEKLNLNDCFVVSGAADQACSALGSGIYKTNQISMVLGSSGVLFSPIEEDNIDKLESDVFIHANDLPFTMTVTNGCGLSYKWFKDNLCDFENIEANNKKVSVYEIINEKAKLVKPLSNNLYYLPYLNGERSPHIDPYATGTFIGIKQNTTKADIARSILEGVGFSFKECFDTFDKKKYQIYVSGGGSKGLLWKEIISSMINQKLYEVDSSDSAALGAAILAMVAMKEYLSFKDAISKIIKVKNVTNPDVKLNKIYEKGFVIYKDLYNALKPMYKEIYESEED